MTKVGHLFALTLCRDTTLRVRPMRERYANVVSIIQRADQVKQDFLTSGWREPHCTKTAQGPTVASRDSG